MKIVRKLKIDVKAGYALMMVLIMASVSLLVLSATMSRTATVANLNQRSNQFNATLNAAEAATEKVVARMRADYLFGGEVAITNNMNNYRTDIPLSTEAPYWGRFQFSDAQGNVNRNYVQMISFKVYTELQSQYAGLSGWRTVYRVISNARRVGRLFDIPAAVQQDLEIDTIPVFQFAIFYNGLLEFTWAAPLTVRGRTHANGNIYTGSSADLKFNETVTASGVIKKKSWAGHSLSSMRGKIYFNGDPGYSTNVPVLSLPIGTNNTAGAVREIINIPPPTESVASAMGEERYYNKAGMVLLVSNTVVTAIIKSAPDDTLPVVLTSTPDAIALSTNFPFLDLDETFTDQRENKTIKTTQIDMAKFATWAATNAFTAPSSPVTKHPSSNPLNILYVADNRTTTSSQLTAVRVVNGTDLPSNPGSDGVPTGFTLATVNPLYVWGNYNCSNPAYLNTTNTSATVPASLISDALTILSSNWQDSQSSGDFKYRDAVNTTVNAALITGTVDSGGSSGTSPFSGGVVNYPRLLEDWGNGSRKLTLNTSMVKLFNSIRATAPFQNPGYYYYAPTRDFNFDTNFKDPTKLPPGTPMLGVILRSKWVNPPPGVTDYAGI